MEVIKKVEYFDKAKTELAYKQIDINFDENNKIVYREMFDGFNFSPVRVFANGNRFTYDGLLLKKSGRGRAKSADLLKIEEMEKQAKEIMSNIEF